MGGEVRELEGGREGWMEGGIEEGGRREGEGVTRCLVGRWKIRQTTCVYMFVLSV